MPQQASTLPITVISAGAGSGKTYTLTERMIEMLNQGVRPSAIMATTFTKKAAAELQERVRARLLETGRSDAANELGSALIGTVHSIGVKILQRFAFEAGVSPLVEIIADGDEQRLFNESLSQILTNERTERMNTLADKLGLSKKGFGEQYDWRKPIRDITDVARANNFSKAVLEKSRIQSWETFQQFLPPVSNISLLTLQNRLISAIEQTIAALENNDADSTKTTKDGVILLRQMENDLKWRGELYWHEWVKIGKINVGAKSRHLMEDLQEIAASHQSCPDFQQDIQGFIDLVFEIATDALSEYEQYKQKRGLIDYTDMETYISKLLRVPSVQETLRNELDLLLVDEFQDTSPIQLDIFLQLSRIARHSIWVGDPKQSIYGFRGAEPALMQAIIEATGGVRKENILDTSWRSRPDIVEATNAIFTQAFDSMPAEQVVLKPHFTKEKDDDFWQKRGDDGLKNRSALVHWHFISELDANKTPAKPWTEHCIAAQIKVLLEQETLIFDKSRKTVRPARAGDIAVLCRNNDGCVNMAEALHKAGLQAGISRAGLLETPEIKLILAWLRRLVNPNDRLSAAEIKLISGTTTLEALLQQIIQAPPEQKWSVLDIAPPGTDLQMRSAAEALDLMLSETDLRRIAAQLGNALQRLDNIEVLRRYAVEYESACNRLHTASTISGFLLWLDHLADNQKDYQGSGESPDTVNVLTYHRSKGLEYPICICNNLDQKLREQIWGIQLVSEGDVDLNNILEGRWLRFWVNPYADLIKNTSIDTQIRQSEAFSRATKQALDEEARLLYVGITRARDYLVFPGTKRGTGWLNRVFSRGNEAAVTLQEDSDETPFYTADGRVLYAHTQQIYQPVDFGSTGIQDSSFDFHAPASGKQFHHNYRIDISREVCPGNPVWHIGAGIDFAPRIDFEGDYTILDKVMTQICAASQPLSKALVLRQLSIRGVETAPDAILLQLQAFERWRQQQWSDIPAQKAVPLTWHTEGRLFETTIDLLLELQDNQWVIIQYLPYSGSKFNIKTAATSAANGYGWLKAALGDLYPGLQITLCGLSLPEGQIIFM